MYAYLLGLRTCCYVLWQICRYYILGQPRVECITQLAMFLSKQNILYAKLFQSLASNASLLTVEEMNTLSRFNDNAPYSEEDIYPIEEWLDSFNKDTSSLSNCDLTIHSSVPDKSGVIAMVYYGTLDNKDIVIKVKRRNIEKKLKEGISNVEFAIHYLNWLPYLNNLNLKVIFQENKQDLLRQVDFLHEIKTMETIRHKYRNTSYVCIPKAYPEYTVCNNQVIVMDKVSGHTLHDRDFSSNQDLKSRFGGLVAKYNMRSILYDRLYHADLHAGNIFFNDDDPNDLKICIIDFGIIGEISKEYQDYFYLFFSNILMEEKTLDAAKVCVDHFSSPKEIVKYLEANKKEELLQELKTIINVIFETECQFDTNMIYTINKTLYKYGLRLNRNFCKIQISLAISSSVCNELCKGTTKYMEYIKHATKELMDSFTNVE